MKPEDVHPGSTLRKKAEKQLKGKRQASRKGQPGDPAALLHELQVHQIELEMQNKELRRAQAELLESQSRYADLYDFAPVGYCTLSDRGLILDINLTGAFMLGLERSLLKNSPFVTFIAPGCRDLFYLYRRKVLAGDTRHGCEVEMLTKKGPFQAALEAVAVREASRKVPRIFMAMSDVTRRRLAEEQLLRSHELLEERVEQRTAELARANGLLRSEVAERKLAEKALRESEKQLRLLSAQLLTAQEQERRRVARDLHDGIGQTLTAVKYRVESILSRSRDSVRGDDEKALRELVSMIHGSVEEVRSIYMNLRPTILDDLGVLATLEWLCREFRRVYSSIRVEKHFDVREVEIPVLLKTVIFRIVQEAMNNVATHSRADLVKLSLEKKDGRLEMAVSDNGTGFRLQEAFAPGSAARGMGLSSMRERAELSGGRLEIETSPGAGTVVRAAWPLEEER